MDKDYDDQDLNSSPEIRRGLCKSDNNDSLFRDLYQFPLSPDIKNSTLNAGDGVNITDVSQLKFSPIYSPSYKSSLVDNSGFDPLDSNDTSFDHRSSLFDNSDNTTYHNALKLKRIPEISISQIPESEQSRKSLTGFSENNEIKKQYSFDIQKQVTPNLLLRTKNFMKKHHSCIDTPPAHWISAPVALTPNRDLVHSCSSIENEVCFLVNQVQSTDFITSVQYAPKCYIKSLDYSPSFRTPFNEIDNPPKLPKFEDNLTATVSEVRAWINKIIDDI
ncbi:unnamed protein product [Schistosoma margrebowiei]|uniref:Uncharacterized protein n=1 Tax=Schistosoma margrebowiei TaxID=48269 RepID=A0AA84ZH12_9TREM|nr:unnamed protein product [Schistosoma margrebowiei]